MSIAAPVQAASRVISNQRLTPEIFSLVLRLPADWGPALPGQFVQLECPPRGGFCLRRPYSLSGCRKTELGTELEIVYGVVGTRSQALSQCRAGETLDLIGPLGRHFTPLPGRDPVLVGGGRGIAPLLMLAEAWKTEFPYGTLLYGARCKDVLIPIPQPPYTLHIATDDGSSGVAGTALDLLLLLAKRGEIKPEENALYACGPNRMLAAISHWAAGPGYPCQVSLETQFGCGTGICAGCAVPVKARGDAPSTAFERYVLACREGPVMDGTRVEWDELCG